MEHWPGNLFIALFLVSRCCLCKKRNTQLSICFVTQNILQTRLEHPKIKFRNQSFERWYHGFGYLLNLENEGRLNRYHIGFPNCIQDLLFPNSKVQQSTFSIQRMGHLASSIQDLEAQKNKRPLRLDSFRQTRKNDFVVCATSHLKHKKSLLFNIFDWKNIPHCSGCLIFQACIDDLRENKECRVVVHLLIAFPYEVELWRVTSLWYVEGYRDHKVKMTRDTATDKEHSTTDIEEQCSMMAFVVNSFTMYSKC